MRHDEILALRPDSLLERVVFTGTARAAALARFDELTSAAATPPRLENSATTSMLGGLPRDRLGVAAHTQLPLRRTQTERSNASSVDGLPSRTMRSCTG